MTWQPVDCHAHSTFSDGALSITDVVERAAALGVRPSLADHISRDVAKSITSVADARRYLDALEQIDVLRAGEFCWHDGLWRELPDDLVRRFTHRLGSVHAVRLGDGTLVRAFTSKLPSGLTVDDYMDAHVASVEQLATEMPVDIFAHPTLVALPYRTLDVDLVWTEERETRIVDALFHAGIAFEISSRYRPHDRIVRRAIARGVRISLGSDGHSFDQVADITRPLAMARQLGVADADLYDPTRHGSKRRTAPVATAQQSDQVPRSLGRPHLVAADQSRRRRGRRGSARICRPGRRSTARPRRRSRRRRTTTWSGERALPPRAHGDARFSRGPRLSAMDSSLDRRSPRRARSRRTARLGALWTRRGRSFRNHDVRRHV